jgi:twitching motility protein PilI
MTETPLAELRGQPFALLRAMEQRAARAAEEHGVAPATRDWVGIGFRLGDERFLAPRDEVREIVACPATLARVPGAKPWLAGLISIRGQLLTVIDLQRYLGGGEIRLSRDSRVLVINHRELAAGLLVDEVLGFRRFPESARVPAPEEGTLRCARYHAGGFTQADETWPVFSLAALGENPSFLQAAEDG